MRAFCASLREFFWGILLLIGLQICGASEEAGFRRRLTSMQGRNLTEMPAKPTYKHPFGSRIDAHFSNVESFHESSKELEEGPVIACVPYDSGSSAQIVLKEVYRGVHTIFQDFKLDKMCYMMTHSRVDLDVKFADKDTKKKRKNTMRGSKRALHRALTDRLTGVQEHAHVLSEFTAWHYMHPVMKIHPSVLNHLFQTGTKYNEVTKLHSMNGLDSKGWNKGLNENSIEDLRYELLVDFVPAVEGGADRQKIMEDIHDHLHSTDNTQKLLEEMQKHHPDGRELWSLGHHCSGWSVLDADADDNEEEKVEDEGRTNSKKRNKRASRMLFSAIADEYYHGFKINSDHLHGWSDRKDLRRLARIDDRELAADIGGISEGCYVAMLAKLALHPEILSISVRPRLKLTNDAAKSIIMSNNNSIPATTVDQKYLWSLQNKGLDGTGQVITIADTGLDQTHCFYAASADDEGINHVSFGTTSFDNNYRKVIQYVAFVDAEDGNGHGTHVAGSAIGSNYNTNANELDGMAVGGKVAFFDIGFSSTGALATPSSYSDMFTAGAAAGSRVFSGAFGYNYNYYSSDSISVDSFSANTNPFYLSIWSAGNEGQEGWYTVIDPSQAKNTLSVGASESSFHADSTYYRDGNRDYIPYFSSVGPAFDFRYKPEVVVPGMVIQSAKDGTTCSVTGYSGTSMAAGVLGGAALLMRQYLTNDTFGCMVCKNFYSSIDGHIYGPSAALLKASLINSAQQMRKFNVPAYNTTKGTEPTTIIRKSLNISGFDKDPADSNAVGISAHRPDFVQGFGRVDLSNVIPLRVESHWDPAPDFNSSFHDFGLEAYDADYWWFTMPSDLNTTEGKRGFKVTLAWMDPPNSVITEKFLLHDLDLIVEKVDNRTDCTVRSPSSSRPIWFGNGGSEPDTHNNVEMIHIPSHALQAGATYRVLVRSKALPEKNYQGYGVVMTYPLDVDISFKDGRRANGVCNGDTFMGDYWAKSMCDPDTHLETEFYLTSHTGNGWDGASRYEITDKADGEVVKSGGMARDNPMSAIREKMTVCLDASSTYDISLVDDSETDSRLYNMGLLSTQCKLKLQGRYIVSESIELTANEDGEHTDDYTGMTGPYICNECASDEVQINMLLWSSVYGGKISYGWDGSAYEIKGIATNAPNAGITEHHVYCVPSNYAYQIGFSEISTDDDFSGSGAADSGFSASTYGYEEYMMDIAVCERYAGTIYALDCNYTAPCTNSFTATCSTGNEEADTSTTNMIIIFIIVLAVLACCSVGAWGMRGLLKRFPLRDPRGGDGDAAAHEAEIEMSHEANGATTAPGRGTASTQARPYRPGQHEGVLEVQAIPILTNNNGYNMGGGRVIYNRPQYQVVHVQEQGDQGGPGQTQEEGQAEAQGTRFTQVHPTAEGEEGETPPGYAEAIATEAPPPNPVYAEHVA